MGHIDPKGIGGLNPQLSIVKNMNTSTNPRKNFVKGYKLLP